MASSSDSFFQQGGQKFQLTLVIYFLSIVTKPDILQKDYV